MHTDFSLPAKVALEYQMEKFEDTKTRPRKPKNLAEALGEVKRLRAEVATAEVRFTDDTAAKTGTPERSIRRDATRPRR